MARPSDDRPADAAPGRVPTRVLLVLDRPVVAELVKLTLDHGAFETQQAVSAAEALVVLGQRRPHLVLLDMDLEGVNGARVMDRIGPGAPGGTPLPTIALTRRGDLRTKLLAFERGVDDILTLPFSPEELLARVVALVRRVYPEAPVLRPVIRLGDLEIDILHRTVRAGSLELHLSALEQSLLYLLAANAGRVLTREEIQDTLWGPDHAVGSNVVDQQVRGLRARLQDDWRRPRFIAPVPGRGYRFLPTFRDDQAARAPDRRA
jgi:DNA-binding response OmpR family regulator